MRRRQFLKRSAGLAGLGVIGFPAWRGNLAEAAAPAAAGLESGFIAPPHAARPLTWWHWLNGNVTREGITGDLEAMRRAGLRGAYLFNVALALPEGPMRFMQPPWLDLVDHTMAEAERLGLDFGVHNCDGWSQAGGPWITPERSMKIMTWTAVDLEEGAAETPLPAPPAKAGFYRDIAVVAFPLPAGRRLNGAGSGVQLGGSLPEAQLRRLIDRNPKTNVVFPTESQTGHTIDFTFSAPQTVRSLTVRGTGGYQLTREMPARLEASDDGETFRTVVSFDLNWDLHEGQVDSLTVAFEPVRATVFRLSFINEWPLTLGDVELSGAARVHYWEARAGWARRRQHGGEAPALKASPGPVDPDCPAACILPLDSVKILTGQMDAAGVLRWPVPAGRWRVLRVGFTTTGKTNGPATTEGRGLECDKFDRAAVRYHLEQFLGRLAMRYGPKLGKAFAAFETDSWECGIQNWTDGMERQFEQAMGYAFLPYLPLFTEGWIVGDYQASQRMLWDWRRFLADRLAEQYFAEVEKFALENKLTYVAEGSGRQQYLYDPIGYQRHCAVPMGEFWNDGGPGGGCRVDNKVAASAAHITGRKYVASESYTSGPGTSRYLNHPYTMKPLGDEAFCAGVNQFVFHTFAHQPWPQVKPGMTMAWFGVQFNRGNTWWEPGRAWIEYLARCQYLLQEGRFAADVLYYLGNEVPARLGWRDELSPVLPAGYDYDGCDLIGLRQARVVDGRIHLPSGMQYRLLLLPDRPEMLQAEAELIAALVSAGATVVGPRPERSPSLAESRAADDQVRAMAQTVWGDCDGERVKHRSYGKGQVFWGMPFPEIFAALNLAPDFEPLTQGVSLRYIHRAIEGGEAYFVANPAETAQELECAFRVAGRQPELWDPATGEILPVAWYVAEADRTLVPLRLGPHGSVFVVFRREAAAPVVRAVRRDGQPIGAVGSPLELTGAAAADLQIKIRQPGRYEVAIGSDAPVDLTIGAVPEPLPVAGPWTVSFPPGWGAPEAVELESLKSWTEHGEFGVKHFSGTATYRKTITLPEGALAPNLRYELDLGVVHELAEIELNGRPLGILWKPPFRLDVTDALQPGENRLQIHVTNLWPNRLIGDESFPELVQWNTATAAPVPERWPDWLLEGKTPPGDRVTFCTRKIYKKTDPLLVSGLLGPVTLIPVVVRRVSS